MSPRIASPLLALFVILAVALLTALLPSYRLFQMTLVLSIAIALFGLNMLIGYSGQPSLGHGAFYAIGAYTAAILMNQVGLPYWATLPVAGAICFTFGFLFGLPALRLESHYLALATFSLAIATPQLLKFQGLEAWTNGVQGILLEKPEPPPWVPLAIDQDQWLFLFTAAVAAVMFWLGRSMLAGRVGRALMAIRDHPTAAVAMGINSALFKTTTFGISALYTGIAGALGAILVQYVAPDSFTIFLSISLLTGVVVGGLGSLWGPLYGALFIQFVPNLADQVSKSAPWAIYGGFLILVMLVMPGGIAGVLRSLGDRLLPSRRVVAAPRAAASVKSTALGR